MKRMSKVIIALSLIISFTNINLFATNNTIDSLINYPATSPSFEDEAEWFSLRHCSNRDFRGDFTGSLDCISYFMEFLERHPNTSLLEDVYLEMINHYQYLECGNEEKSWAYLKAIYYCNQLIEDHTAFAADHFLSARLVELMQLLDNEMWDISLEVHELPALDNEMFLNINLTRKSNTTKTRTIAIAKDAPSVDIYLYKEDGSPIGANNGLVYEFSEGELTDNEMISIKPGETFEQTINLKEWIPSLEELTPGYYEIQIKRNFVHPEAITSEKISFSIN